jgi:hypothetical protein
MEDQMANQTKAEAAAALQAAGIQRKAFTIPVFCARNGDLSEGFYYRMKAAGLGPRETKILSRIFISEEDETEWRRQRAAETDPTEAA